MAILQNEPFTNHSEFIQECINLILQSDTSQRKVIYAKILYDYMRDEGFDYVMRHEHFKATTIKKAYQLKRESTNFVELHNSLNCYLIACGAPLEVELEELEVELEVELEEVEVEEVEL